MLTPPETTTSPRAQAPGSRRVAERRNRVFRAAVELFVEQGFEKTTMDEVAERADVARASVFNYFQRKSAFLDEWSERRRVQAAQALSAVGGSDEVANVWTALRDYMRELARINEETREETQALLTASVRTTNVLAHPPLAEVLLPYFVAAHTQGQIAATADIRQAATLLATGYVANVAAWIDSDPRPFDLAAALDGMVDVVFSGLQPR